MWKQLLMLIVLELARGGLSWNLTILHVNDIDGEIGEKCDTENRYYSTLVQSWVNLGTLFRH